MRIAICCTVQFSLSDAQRSTDTVPPHAPESKVLMWYIVTVWLCIVCTPHTHSHVVLPWQCGIQCGIQCSTGTQQSIKHCTQIKNLTVQNITGI